MQSTAGIVDLVEYRRARELADAVPGTPGTTNDLTKVSRYLTRTAQSLERSKHQLVDICDGLQALEGLIKRSQDFCSACATAVELDDLDEMIRRRDALTLELEGFLPAATCMKE